MNNRFEGYYLKHQAPGHSLALIPGKSRDTAFIQVVTGDASYNIGYPADSYSAGNGELCVGGCRFSEQGAVLDIEGDGLSLHGELSYGKMQPINGDIMGPFRFFPMECRHTVASMGHTLEGWAELNGERLSFYSGRGYIEGDSGRSFPRKYAWMHCNDFPGDCSIMASAALIPFWGTKFWGTICVIMLGGREHRLATYRGAKIKRCEPGILVVEQGGLLLEAVTEPKNACELLAPQRGEMGRRVRESLESPGHFRLSKNGRDLFSGSSERASCEFSGLQA